MMYGSWNPTRLVPFSALALWLLTMAGCGNGAGAAPTEEVARSALERTLNTWRDGGNPGAIPETEPPVLVHDTPWSQGERLGSYEILQEDTSKGKCFKVRLSLSKPLRTEEVEYYVLGVSPLMIFRDQDYLRNINMENGPKLLKSGRQGRSSNR
ncbi:hypothetical protein P12x_003414 [Tundrisphaera lichenicola]|uniref:hypothetical protein n=1 Tax=Tundrisphaera lichenicola TaxID=2029860 RepID=UPI003EB72B92